MLRTSRIHADAVGASPRTSRPYHVLLVDDDEDLRALSAHAITRAGNGMSMTIADGESCAWAESAALDAAPDAIVLDVNLPDGNGIDLCRSLRASVGCAHTPIIIITARNDWDTVSLAYDAGATDFIAKPFAPEQLGQRVQHALRSQAQSLRAISLQRRLDLVRSIGQLGDWELRSDGQLIASDSLGQLLGVPAGELDSVAALLDRLPPAAREALSETIDAASDTGHAGALQHVIEAADGESCDVVHSIDVMHDANAAQTLVVGVVGLLGDVTGSARPAERRAAAFDPHTGLPGLRMTIDAIESALETSHDGHQSGTADALATAILYTRTRSIGTHVATSAAAIHSVAAPSFVGRHGQGVVVMLQGATLTSVAELAKAMHAAVVRNTGERLSVGVAFAGADGDDAATLCAAAVAAARRIDQSSPDRLAFANPTLQSRAHGLLLLPSAVRCARVSNQIRLRYGAVASRSTGHYARYIVTLESIGAGQVDGHPRLVLELLEADAPGIDAGFDLCVSLAAASLAQRDLVQRLVRLARRMRAGLELHLDDLPTSQPAWLGAALQALRSAGIRIGAIAQDPSMTELAGFRDAGVDVLCLAPEATRRLAACSTPAVLLRALLAASHGLGLEVFADGVDNGELHGRLRACGVDALAGPQVADTVTLSDLSPAGRHRTALHAH